MRENWNRSTNLLEFSAADLTRLIQPAFPGQSVIGWEAARGGLANTNLRVNLSAHPTPVLVRLYVRDPAQGRKEIALYTRVSGRVPVPRVYYFAEQNPLTDHPYALMEWIEGERLEVVAPHITGTSLAALGHAVGRALAGIHSVTFPQTGFFNAALEIETPISVGSNGLLGYLRECLITGRGGARLGEPLTSELMAYAETQAPLLDAYQGPPCLVHGDFGGSNILVREGKGTSQVAAVLDWEFAFSGAPFFDLGNLLRPPFGDLDDMEQAVYDGYTVGGGSLPRDWRKLSRLDDLLAWADFLNRPNTNAALVRDARANIQRTLAAR